MGLAAPLFLLGIAAVAIPLWLHLMNRSDPTAKPFSSLLLMEAGEQSVSSKRQLSFYALLASRILLLLLLALLFSQPYVNQHHTQASDDQHLHLLVVDQSASMRSDDIWRLVADTQQEILETLPREDWVQWVSAAQTLRFLGAPEPVQTVRAPQHAQLQAGYQAADYGAWMRQLESFVDQAEQATTLHLISDFQQSNFPLRLADLRARGAQVMLHPIARDALENWRVEAQFEDTDLVIQLRGFHTPAASIPLQVELAGQSVWQQTVQLSSNGSHRVSIANLDLAADQPEFTVHAQVDDALDSDNQISLVYQAQTSPKVLVFSASSDTETQLFVKTALGALSTPRFEVTEASLNLSQTYALNDFDLIIVSDFGQLSEQRVEQLSRYTEDGGSLWLMAGPASQTLSNTPLTAHSLTRVATNLNQQTLRLQLDQSTHPALDGLTRIVDVQVQPQLSIQPSASDQTLLRTSNGAPWLLQARLGSGRLLLQTTNFNRDVTDFALATSYVPFIQSLGQYLTNYQPSAPVLPVGSVVRVGGVSAPDTEVATSATAQQIFRDDQPLVSLSQLASGVFYQLQEPGVYRVQSARSNSFISAYVPIEESDLQPESAATLARWPVDSQRAETTLEGAIPATTQIQPQSLSPWLIPFVALLLLFEIIMANQHLWVRRESTS